VLRDAQSRDAVKRDSDRILETTQAEARRWLPESQRLGRAAQVAMLCNGREAVDVTQFHGINPINRRTKMTGGFNNEVQL
jgi:hypothetical protein